MEGAIWILVFTIVAGVALYIGELRWRARHKGDASDSGSAADSPAAESAPGEAAEQKAGEDGGQSECCGQHLVCEKESLSPMSIEIEYYDDEELDRFIGRTPDSYSSEESEEFRDVLMTLRPADIPGWARSVTQRHLELPTEVRDELLMLVNEQREAARRH